MGTIKISPCLFIALFTIAKKLKQPKCPPMKKIKTLYEYNSAMRKKEILLLATKGVKLESIMISKKKKRQRKANTSVLSLTSEI